MAHSCTAAIVSCLLAIASASAQAGVVPATQPASETQSTAIDNNLDTLEFREQAGGPAGRLGGGTRGAINSADVFILCSARIGKTIYGKPSIFWYLTRDTKFDVDLLIARPGDVAPLYRQRHSGAHTRGLHEFSLGDAPAELKIGAIYQVTIMLLTDARDSSHNPYSTGLLERVAAPSTIAGADPRPADFAQAGLWYDALGSLAHKIGKDATNVHLRKQRLSLLRQQHVFLTFDPEKKWLTIPSVTDAYRRAQIKERQLLDALGEDDQVEMKN